MLTDDERALLADLQARAGEDEGAAPVVVVEAPTVEEIEAAGHADAERIEAAGHAEAELIEARAEAEVETIEARAEAEEQVIEAVAEVQADPEVAAPADNGPSGPPDPAPRSRHWLYRPWGRK